jgi:flagellar hook-associated protein 2
MGIQFSGLASGLDTTSIIRDLMKVERTRVETVEKEKVLAEWKKEAWTEMNAKLYSFYTKEAFDFKSSGTYLKKQLTSSNPSLVTMNASKEASGGTHAIEVTTMAKGSFLTGTELTNVTSTSTAAEMFGITADGVISLSLDGGITTTDVAIKTTDTMADITKNMKALGLDLNVSYDSNFKRMFLSSTKTGTGVNIQISGDEAILSGLGFGTAAAPNRTGSVGVDAAFKYNGTSLTSSTNVISVNGLSFNILGEGGSSTITVTQDTDAIYNTVKTFLNKYNELMAEMNTKIGADSTRTFKPLTTEEKSAMTDEDVTLWETKIKKSLLRRDDTLTSITSSLRGFLTGASGVDTSSFTYKSLSSLGIVTGNYTEKGLLHIEGDEDDSLYSVKTNKLRNAINDNPEAVQELMTAIGTKLYSDLNTRMKSSTLSSALTFYNDKSMTKTISAYDTKISDLEDRLAAVEARYYKQFTAMEQAIQRSNSTGDWLTQQLAGM